MITIIDDDPQLPYMMEPFAFGERKKRGRSREGDSDIFLRRKLNHFFSVGSC